MGKSQRQDKVLGGGGASSVAASQTLASSRMRFAAFLAALFSAGLIVNIGLQWAARAYDAEFGSIVPDEASHFINSLLIAHFLTEGLGTAPMAFAKNFAMHYPKVGIGHWPPLFYVLASGWMIVISESKAASLVLSALITAALATLIGAVIARRHGRAAGMVGGLAFALLPVVRESAKPRRLCRSEGRSGHTWDREQRAI
jgi:hypothetical protein